jgi:small subunit ribosomal protein S21
VIEIKKSDQYVQHPFAPINKSKKGIGVKRRKGESNEDLLKRFRKKFSKSGIMKEVRESSHYEKPSDKRRRKKAQSIRNLKREQEKLERMQERAFKKRMKERKKKKYEKVHKSRKQHDHRETSRREEE